MFLGPYLEEGLRDMAEKMKSITESTLLPISMVITLSGGIAWLTTIYNITVTNEKAIERVESKQDRYNENLAIILNKLANIEGRLNLEKE